MKMTVITSVQYAEVDTEHFNLARINSRMPGMLVMGHDSSDPTYSADCKISYETIHSRRYYMPNKRVIAIGLPKDVQGVLGLVMDDGVLLYSRIEELEGINKNLSHRNDLLSKGFDLFTSMNWYERLSYLFFPKKWR